jgi:cell division protease FtsH
VLPLEDRYSQTRAEMLDQLVYALGGRAAEELVFHEPTTGASNDIEKATALARSMVTEYGMSARLGAVKYGTKESEPFLGRDYGHQRDYSEEIASWIDEEVRGLIEAAHDEAWEILVQYRDTLDALVLELAERETLNKEDLDRILAPVRKRPPHAAFSGFGKRTPSDRPPVEIPATVRSNGSVKNGSAFGNPPPQVPVAQPEPGAMAAPGGFVFPPAPVNPAPPPPAPPSYPPQQPSGYQPPPYPGAEPPTQVLPAVPPAEPHRPLPHRPDGSDQEQ